MCRAARELGSGKCMIRTATEQGSYMQVHVEHLWLWGLGHVWGCGAALSLGSARAAFFQGEECSSVSLSRVFTAVLGAGYLNGESCQCPLQSRLLQLASMNTIGSFTVKPAGSLWLS